MDVDAIFGAKLDQIQGSSSDEVGVNSLIERLPTAVSNADAFDAWRSLPIVGVEFYIDEEVDPTGMGVEMSWMSLGQVEEESLKLEPGLSFAPLGFLPFGICLLGSGDPYFLDLRGGSDDPPVVRIPHDAAIGPSIEQVEPVAETLSDFVARTDIES